MLRERRIAPRRRRRAGAALTVAAVMLTVAPAGAEVSTAPATHDAWYQAPLASDLEPLCAAPTGCNPMAATYPTEALHVGSLNGGTTEFSAVMFDTGVLPPFAEFTGGTAIFPVLGPDQGSFAVDTATVTTCLVRETFDEVAGAAADQAPRYDCSVRSPATYDAEAEQFTVDLAPFVEAWDAGGPLALVLLPDSADVGNWHVALAGREDAERAPKADLLWRSPAPGDNDGGAVPGDREPVPPGDDAAPPTSAPTSAPTSRPVGTTSPPASAEPPPPGPVVAEPGEGGPRDTPEQPIVTAAEPVPVPYPYKAAWLLPLVMLIAAASLTRSLDEEVAVIPADAPKGLRARLWLALWPEQ